MRRKESLARLGVRRRLKESCNRLVLTLCLLPIISSTVSALNIQPASSCTTARLKVGQRFEFFCHPSNGDILSTTAVFSKGDSPLDLRSPRYEVEYVMLVVHKLTQQDSGLYRCTARDPSGNVIGQHCIDLKVTSELSPPMILRTPKSPPYRRVLAGRPERLFCISPDAVMVWWFKDGDVIVSSDNGRIRWNNTSQLISFSAMYPNDTGNYSCEVSGLGGVSSAFFFRQVVGVTVTTPKPPRMSHVIVAPSVVSKNQLLALNASTIMRTADTMGAHVSTTTAALSDQSTDSPRTRADGIRVHFCFDLLLTNPREIREVTSADQSHVLLHVSKLIEHHCLECSIRRTLLPEVIRSLSRDASERRDVIRIRVSVSAGLRGLWPVFATLSAPFRHGNYTTISPDSAKWTMVAFCANSPMNDRFCWNKEEVATRTRQDKGEPAVSITKATLSATKPSTMKSTRQTTSSFRADMFSQGNSPRVASSSSSQNAQPVEMVSMLTLAFVAGSKLHLQ